MDIIESVLLTDPNYLAQCDSLDMKLESMSKEELEETCDSICCSQYPQNTTAIDDEDLEEGDFIDREVEEFLAAEEDDSDGELIDLVSGLNNSY